MCVCGDYSSGRVFFYRWIYIYMGVVVLTLKGAFLEWVPGASRTYVLAGSVRG